MQSSTCLRLTGVLILSGVIAPGCGQRADDAVTVPAYGGDTPPAAVPARPEVYAEFPLVADLSGLSSGQREMLKLLIDASQIMDDLFWRQALGDGYQAWLASIGVDDTRRFAELNYGPWD
ncbi:MAG: dipeptidyl-peptidase 3 family protein, partial [Woeseiaceae bacterium]